MPAIGRDGMERLKDSADAKEWQEAVRALLGQEVEARAQEKLEADRSTLDTLHSSIGLFASNKDLIPGTRDFNKTLADEFARTVQPYEIRSDGKLIGYSVPVQPIIDVLRKQTQAPTTVASGKEQTASPAPAQPAAGQSPAADPPQAGIPTKAGSSAEKEDFSVLFGTIGLPNLQI